eukprot:CAMPEP_0173348562 /NCGR_PEP_ID=MMETSP1144-20121109/13807_1 /TAXON_ID=483371 /ORGANISM="non described non described, Strain CCMP2298" /LENGTH=44 /DNA_ID= /DNA_START= /DNA_END= /DNA_ORIENTATION=
MSGEPCQHRVQHYVQTAYAAGLHLRAQEGANGQLAQSNQVWDPR